MVANNVVPITSANRRKVKDPYNFDPGFERGLVVAACASRKFYAFVGEELDPDCLGDARCKLALTAAQAIAHDDESHRGPADCRQLLQRLRSWMNDGKVTLAQIEEVMELVDGEIDAGLPDHGALLTEVKPILVRRLQRESLEVGLAEFQRKGDPERALSALTRAKKIGVVGKGIGNVLGPASIDQMSRLAKVQRLKTGLPELDDALEGGALRRTLSMFIGGSGAGKSMGLCQVATAGARQGFHVGVGTLEVPEEVWTARLVGNLTGRDVNEFISDPYGCGAVEELDEYLSNPGFGKIQVQSFTAKATTPQDMFAWVKACEDEWGQSMDLLVVDYADKLGAKGAASGASTYITAGSVYEDLYDYAKESNKWVWTGSQSTRGQKTTATKVLDLDDVSDSMHKIRTADLVVTLNPRDDYTSMIFFTAKNRLGRPRQKVGPYPCDFACARIAPPSHGVIIL